MSEMDCSRLLQLRLAVGYLGERSQYAWWPTSFFETASKQFLEPVFVKSASQAQYHGVLEAARRVHDERLSVGSYHLFRLPEEMEQDLFALVQGDAGLVAAASAGKNPALYLLHGLVGTMTTPTSQGPTLVGTIGDLAEPDTIAKMASVYLRSFTDGNSTFPYLTGKR